RLESEEGDAMAAQRLHLSGNVRLPLVLLLALAGIVLGSMPWWGRGNGAGSGLTAVLAEASPHYALQEGKVVVEGDVAKPQAAAVPGPGDVGTLDLRRAYERSKELAGLTRGRVFKETITPHWFAGNTRFWYRNDLRKGTREFILVDAEKGTRGPAF